MTAGDRFKSWIDTTVSGWSGRIAGWAANTGAAATEKVAGRINPTDSQNIRNLLQGVMDDPQASDEVKAAAGRLLPDWGPLQDVLGEIIWFLTSITSLISGNNVFKREWELYFDNRERTARLDPISMITAWRRDPDTYDGYFEDLKEQGWSDDRIEALKFVTQFYPGASDLVRFQAREVFEPEMISRYGLDDEFGGINLEPFRKGGVTDEIALWYWRAHWEHASWNQVVEMLHRGQLDEDQVRDWFRLVEIPPFWRDRLIATSWNVPTRVDVRRFYDLKTITEERLREIYTAMGYHDKDLDDYVLWTKIYVELPDLIARWKNGWITLNNARERLVELGMSYEAAEELVETKVKVEQAEADTEGKALTKTEIYKGVKQGKITRAEGVELLMDLDYSGDKAELLLDLNAPESETDAATAERQLSKTDIKTALANGILTETEARVKLSDLGYSAANVDLLIRIFNAVNNPPETAATRQLSKTDIIDGVKKGVITANEGYLMLQDIGFSAEDSNFLLSVKAEESPFSPVDISEFKDLTTKLRRAAGMVTLPVPDDLREAAKDLARVSREVGTLELAVKNERRQLTDEETAPESATKKLKELEVALNRARAEKERLQVKYDGLVTAWKYSQEGK